MSSTSYKKMVFIGAGGYGTALSIHFAHNQHNVALLPRRKDHAEDMKKSGENTAYLPGVQFPQSLEICDVLPAITNDTIVFLTCPAQSLATTYDRYRDHIPNECPIIICAKGIQKDTLQLPHEMLKNCPNPIAIFSGPHFAREVNSSPSAVTLASRDATLAMNMSIFLSNPTLRVYPETDIISVQIAGALKNVIAIATGIARGLDFGDNAIAALITRGLAEIRRLGVAMGGNTETFFGLSCVGDLVLTCSSEKSRNTSLGMEIANGTSLDDILNHRNTVAEGVPTTKAAHALMQKYDIYMPLTSAVYDVLYNEKSPRDVISKLMNGDMRWEKS